MVNHFTFHDTRLLLISKATSSFGLHQTNVWTCTIYKLVDLLLCLSSYEDLLYEDCCWVGRKTSIFQIALFYASHLIDISFESCITRMSISRNDFSILTTSLHLWVTNENLIFLVYQSEGLISWKKRPHHHSELSSTSSIIKVPPMHNVEAPPALFIQFHKKIEWTCQSSCTMVAHIHLIFKFYVLNDVDFFDFCCCRGGRYEINFWYH